MKKLLTLALAIISIQAIADIVPVPVPVKELYAPEGFDSNDEVEVVVEGYLPNLCYSYPKTEAIRRGKNIFINVIATHSKQTFCAEAIVPFLEVVKLGTLPQGRYKVSIMGESSFVKTSVLEIGAPHTNNIDDNIYARVDYVEVVEGSREVRLKGENPSDCFELDRIEYKSNGVNTYSVLPIMKQVASSCPIKPAPFSHKFIVPDELKRDKILLHVRSMDRRSINRLWNHVK